MNPTEKKPTHNKKKKNSRQNKTAKNHKKTTGVKVDFQLYKSIIITFSNARQKNKFKGTLIFYI